MILESRSSPAFAQTRFGWAVVFVLFVFVLGLAAGFAIRPATQNRIEPPPSTTAAAATEASPVVRTAHRAEVLRVLDGDTFEARVHLWPGLDITTRVRLRGVDAPELKARCREERERAEAARNALKAMLDQGEVGIMRVTLDKYGGRVLADASSFATPDIAASLLNAGYVRPYGGARRETWCS